MFLSDEGPMLKMSNFYPVGIYTVYTSLYMN